MLSRSKILSKLLDSRESREDYIQAKLNVLIPSQIRALRLYREWSQKELGDEAEMKQARISATEKPGEVNFSLATLIRLAAAFRVGLQVRFVPFSEMLDWENQHKPDDFAVTKIENDRAFLSPPLSSGDSTQNQISSGKAPQSARMASAASFGELYMQSGILMDNTGNIGVEIANG